jgi:hypothetical protein
VPLAALEHKTPKAQPIALATSLNNLLLGERIAFHRTILGPEATIIAATRAAIGDLHKAPDIDSVTKPLGAHLSGKSPSIVEHTLLVGKTHKTSEFILAHLAAQGQAFEYVAIAGHLQG